MSASSPQATDLAALTRDLRITILRMIASAKSSHVGSAFSMVELLTVLYFRILNLEPANPQAPGRDRFILSKAHGAAALYATLAKRGFFPPEVLATYYADGGSLPGHADAQVPGVEVSAGSLGHGLAMAAGMALAERGDASGARVFVLLGDGECDEGSVWEAALFASSAGLENLVAIVDYNKLQGMGFVENVVRLEPLAAKWRAFGWETCEIDGHDLGQIEATLARAPFRPGRPSAVIAHTVKGRGVSFMENQLLWHYRSPDPGELRAALAELEAGA